MNMASIKGIRYFSNLIFNNNDYSYAHSALQSMSCLECTKEFLLINNFDNLNTSFRNYFKITIELYNLFSMLYVGKEAFSQDLINYYTEKVNNKNLPNSAFKSDPFHFLYYLFELLHYENNRPYGNYDIKQLYFQSIQNQKNDNYMFNIFYNFFKLTQNSFISTYFYNIEKTTTNCPSCGLLYFYSIKKIFRFNVDLYKIYRDNYLPAKIGSKLNLHECFLCYIGGGFDKCSNCGNATSKTIKICCSTKVLLIFLDRTNHPQRGDIDFPLNLNIINYFSISRSNFLPFMPLYNLKACISYDFNRGKYFADCNGTINNMNGWYRFIDNEVYPIINPQIAIYKYEPQFLVYELDSCGSLKFNPFLLTNTINLNFSNFDNQSFFANFNSLINKLNLNENNLMSIPNSQQANENIMNNDVRSSYAYINRLLNNNNNINNNINNNKNNNNINNINNNNNKNNIFNNNINNNINNQMNFNPMKQKKAFSLKFVYVPESGDQSETPLNRILAQVLSDFTFEKACINFFTKLTKKKEAIKKFLYKGKEIPANSQSTLESLNIDENSTIMAIKSENFDQLNIEGNSI